MYSDLDLLLYVDKLPGEEALTRIRNAVDGANPSRRGDPTEDFCSEEFDVNGSEPRFPSSLWLEPSSDSISSSKTSRSSTRHHRRSFRDCSRACLFTATMSSNAGGAAFDAIPSRCVERWSSDTGTSSRSGTTSKRWHNGTPGIEPEAAADELGRLIDETHALVAAELPDLLVPLRFPPGTRQQPWSA